MGRFLPPDPSRGDPDTIGGYMAVHDRPAAFDGMDGMSYSVEILADETGDPARPWGGYIMFLRWRRIGVQGVEGHLESGWLAYGRSEGDVRGAVGRMPLGEVKALLDGLLSDARSRANETRPWWDVMRDEE